MGVAVKELIHLVYQEAAVAVVVKIPVQVAVRQIPPVQERSQDRVNLQIAQITAILVLLEDTTAHLEEEEEVARVVLVVLREEIRVDQVAPEFQLASRVLQ